MLPLKSSLPRFRITPIGIVIGCVPLLLVMYGLFRNPDVSFRSSDSNWAGGESSFKGFGFDSVAFSFEMYRLKCQADSAQLIRTTKMQWWNVFAWPSYMTDPKWNVPYGQPDPRIGSSILRGKMAQCARAGLTLDEREFARRRSAELVLSFSHDGQQPHAASGSR